MAEINMVPMIDVMLVLLIIFIVTAPLLTHAVKVELPQASSTPNITKPDNIQLAIDADGAVHWNGELTGIETMRTLMSAAALLQPQPELHLRADRITPYEKVAQVMSEAARSGLTKIGFITEPEERK
ncbi:MAG: biopolymer transporter ExbD [Alphaproteobacteria bacterium]